MNENEKLLNKVQELIEQGNIEDAETILLTLRRQEESPELNFIISKLLVDFGHKTKKLKYLNEAIGKLKSLSEYDFHRLHFYLGNAYLFKYDILEEKPNYLNNSEKLLYNAKLEFKKEIDNNPNELLHGALVNLGLIYDMIGRTIESLEIFNLVCEKFGTDYGLYYKGYVLYTFTTFTNDPKLSIKEAYKCFKIILENPKSKHVFKEKSRKMINLILKSYTKEFLEEEIEDDGIIEVTVDNDFEFFMVNYCFENKLNLNLCDFCQNCSNSLEDSLVIENMIYQKAEDNNETSLSLLSSYLNQIKMDYISARTLLILSEYKEIGLDSITKYVYIMDTDFSEENGIRTQLLKDSFKNFFNILDKIAFFIKDYLGFENEHMDINFRTLWNKPEIHNILIQTKNPGLNALYDIYLDLEFDYNRKYLRDTRNALTHKYLKITSEKYEITDKTLEELKNETLEIAHLVKNAIIYLMRFVKINEEYWEEELEVEIVEKKEVEL